MEAQRLDTPAGYARQDVPLSPRLPQASGARRATIASVHLPQKTLPFQFLWPIASRQRFEVPRLCIRRVLAGRQAPSRQGVQGLQVRAIMF